MLNYLLDELQRVLTPIALAAFTGFVAWAFVALKNFLGIVESDSNEGEIRRAAETAAGVLIKQDAIMNPDAIAEAASRVIADLPTAVKAEGYEIGDIKDMIIGAAGLVIPGANILKSIIR